MKTVIMAGGKGTRIAQIASDIPKPMIPVDGVPVLEQEIDCLREQGYTDLILTVSHLGHVIMDYFGDGSGVSPATGKPFGVTIEYYVEREPLGNSGALFRLKDKLTEDFLLLNGDAVFNVDFERFVAFHRAHGGLATLFTHPNDHPFDSGLIVEDENHNVVDWLTKEDERPRYYRNLVNAGLHVISPRLLDTEVKTEKVDLDRQLLKPLAGTGKLFAYQSPEYVKDMGTPARLAETCRDLQSGRVAARNLRIPQRAIFLDRDGTINRYVGFVRRPEELELLPDAAAAIRRINAAGYLAIVITNQPVIARGEVTYAQLREIHNKMETLLGSEGAYIDGLYFCPHHPHKGYEGEIPELKFDCGCRKPKPGLLLDAARDYNIDLSSSWMIGDSQSDIEAGKAAGCRTALIGTKEDRFGQNVTDENLLAVVETILNKGA